MIGSHTAGQGIDCNRKGMSEMKMKASKQDAVWKELLIGGGSAVLIAVALSMLCALLIVSEVLPPSLVPYLALGIAAVAVFIAASAMIARSQSNKMLIGIGTAAIFFAMNLVCKLLWFPNQMQNLWQSALVCLAAAVLSMVTASAGKRKHAYRKGK